MLLNNSPLKNTSEKLKSPQTSIKTLKIERKKDFQSFLKYVERESKALEDIKLPSLNETRNKKTSLIGSVLGLGALGLLAFFAGDGEGDPNDQPNKFDYFDPEAFKRTLNTQSKISSLSYTGMKAANFFDDGGGGRQPRRMINITPDGDDFDFSTSKFGKFANQNMLFGEDYSPFNNKQLKGSSALTDALAEVDEEMGVTEEYKKKKRLQNLKKRIGITDVEVGAEKRQKVATIDDFIKSDDPFDVKPGGTSDSKEFKNKEEALREITKQYSKDKKPNFFSGTSADPNRTFSIDDPEFDLKNNLDADEFQSNLGNKAKRQAGEDALLDEIYKKPQKNKFQKFFDTGIPRLFARGTLALLNIGGKFLQIEPLISPILSPEGFAEGTRTADMDVFGNMPGDPNFDEDSRGIYSDYMVFNEAAMKEMRQIKINYLTGKMMTGEIETPDLTRGLDFNNFSVPSGAFQPPTEGNSDSVIPFILPEESVGSSVLDSLILLELERY
jgi:hypothetical protein